MQKILFNISMVWRTIQTNKLRSILTIAIIALGITVLVGILTATEVMKSTVYSSFSSMGANSFQIRSGNILQKNKKRRNRIYQTAADDITYLEATTFKSRYPIPSVIALSTVGTQIATAQFGAEKTNPNLLVMGMDNEYFTTSDTKLEAGRIFNKYELADGHPVAVVGNGIISKLFKGKAQNAINKVVNIDAHKYRIIGVAESKGGSMMMNADNLVMIPLYTARKNYGSDNFVITVLVNNIKAKHVAQEEAEGLFRNIRKLPVGYLENFTVEQNDEMAKMVMESINSVSIAAMVIAVITLLGSVIGLMNIMLVSVSERTREIGISKALGAKNKTIREQFLSESVIISLLGGILGVVFGILLGNLLGIALKTSFVVPWLWMFIAMMLCALVGIISGVYPAVQASKLNPINALRYE